MNAQTFPHECMRASICVTGSLHDAIMIAGIFRILHIWFAKTSSYGTLEFLTK